MGQAKVAPPCRAAGCPPPRRYAVQRHSYRRCVHVPGTLPEKMLLRPSNGQLMARLAPPNGALTAMLYSFIMVVRWEATGGDEI
jgi:hypothetical protein